jgi:hypothetical protein
VSGQSVRTRHGTASTASSVLPRCRRSFPTQRLPLGRSRCGYRMRLVRKYWLF